MQTASVPATPDPEPRSDRVMAVYGILAGVGGSLFIGLFWSMGAILLLTHNGGLLTELDLQGAWRWLFFSYPFVTLLCAAGAALLYMLRRNLEAVGLAAAPIGLVVVYFIALHFRG